MASNYRVEDFDQIEAVPCPCGSSKRAFAGDQAGVATFHKVKIAKTSRKHYHKIMTEIYYVLEGHGQLEVDDDLIELRPGISVMIQPGCRHRAKGDLTLINVAIPAFMESDEYFDD